MVKLKLTCITGTELEATTAPDNIVPDAIGSYLGLEKEFDGFNIDNAEGMGELRTGETYYLLTEDELLAILSR